MDWSQVSVNHVQYGEGIVLSCSSGFIKVHFESVGDKNFVYPGAFEKFLKASDPEVNAAVTADIIMKKAEETAVVKEQLAVSAAVAAATAKTAARKPAPRARTAASRAHKIR